MSWRVVVISTRCKLDYSMNYMVIRGEETKRILLDEIAVLLVENNAVSLTGCLLSALIDKKIKVVFCDSSRSPQFELVPYYGSHNSPIKIKQQIAWSNEAKLNVWTSIVKEKIRNQAILLARNEKDREKEILMGYIDKLQVGDKSNREGHAAKVYFNALFGKGFTRSDDENPINSALNYGYSLILSAINREVVYNGFLTQIGLSHDNQFNQYNLSCDLMEPFRVVIDQKVMESIPKSFGTDEKHRLIGVLNDYFIIQSSEQTLLNALRIYVKSVFMAIEDDNPSLIKYIEL